MGISHRNLIANIKSSWLMFSSVFILVASVLICGLPRQVLLSWKKFTINRDYWLANCQVSSFLKKNKSVNLQMSFNYYSLRRPVSFKLRLSRSYNNLFFTFELNLYLAQCLLYVKLYANETKCKTWHQQRFVICL